VGTRAVGDLKRCHLDEFVNHIWKEGPGPKDTKQPKVSWGGKFKQTGQLNPKNVASKIASEKIPGTDNNLTGNSDARKVHVDAKDYYSAFEKVGEVVRAAENAAWDRARASTPEGKIPRLKAAEEKLFVKTKDAIQVVVDMRWADMDDYRITKGGLKTELGKEPETKLRKPVVSNADVVPWLTLDVDATIEKYKDDDPKIKENLESALERYYAKDHPKNHLAAINSAEAAASACGL
jgi:hypothetical protein